jgi:hypothetical protein
MMKMPGRIDAMKANFRKLTMVPAALAVLTMAGYPIPGHAAPITATPSVSVEQGYDSNVFDNRTGNEKDDFILRVRPAVSFAFPAVDTAVNLDLSGETDTYYNNTDLSKYPATWRAALNPLRPIAISPILSMSPRGYYLETYDSSRRSQFLFSPTAPTIPIELAQFARTHTRDYGGSLNMAWQAAPQFQTGLTGAYNRHEILTDNTGQTDYYTYTGDLTLSYQPGTRSSIGIFGNASDTTYSNDMVSTTYSVGLQGSYAFTEFFRVEGRVGESFLRNKPGGGLPESTDQSPNASLSLTYRSRDFTATTWGSFGYSSGGSLGQTTRQMNAGLSLGDQFASGWWWSLIGSYQANRNIDNPSIGDLTSGTGTAEIRYVHAPWATVRLSGTYFREWAQDSAAGDLKKTTAFLGVTFSNTYSLY